MLSTRLVGGMVFNLWGRCGCLLSQSFSARARVPRAHAHWDKRGSSPRHPHQMWLENEEAWGGLKKISKHSLKWNAPWRDVDQRIWGRSSNPWIRRPRGRAHEKEDEDKEFGVYLKSRREEFFGEKFAPKTKEGYLDPTSVSGFTFVDSIDQVSDEEASLFFAEEKKELEHSPEDDRRDAIVRKHFPSKQQDAKDELNLLTYSAKEQILYLLKTDALNWPKERILESFPVTEKQLEHLMTTEWHPLDELEILKHDAQVLKNWDKSGRRDGPRRIVPTSKIGFKKNVVHGTDLAPIQLEPMKQYQEFASLVPARKRIEASQEEKEKKKKDALELEAYEKLKRMRTKKQVRSNREDRSQEKFEPVKKYAIDGRRSKTNLRLMASSTSSATHVVHSKTQYQFPFADNSDVAPDRIPVPPDAHPDQTFRYKNGVYDYQGDLLYVIPEGVTGD